MKWHRLYTFSPTVMLDQRPKQNQGAKNGRVFGSIFMMTAHALCWCHHKGEEGCGCLNRSAHISQSRHCFLSATCSGVAAKDSVWTELVYLNSSREEKQKEPGVGGIRQREGLWVGFRKKCRYLSCPLADKDFCAV